MSKEDRRKMMGYVLEDWIWRIESGIPLENARYLTFRDYELTTPEKELLMIQMLKILEDKVGVLERK